MKAQWEMLCIVSHLIIEDLITVRNVFHYYLEGCNPNGYRLDDNKEVAEALRVVAEIRSWPHGIYCNNNNDLG